MKLKITLLFLTLTGMSFGATITLSSVGENYDGTDDYGILLANGDPVAENDGVARVGIFTTLSDAQVTTMADDGDYAALYAAFTTIVFDDFTGINDAYGANPGFVAADTSGYTVANVGESLYVFIMSGDEYGLFRSTEILAADPVTPPETTYNIRFSSGTAVIGAFGDPYEVPYTGIGGGPTMVQSFQLVAIPEPSSALLAALGALGLLRRRRI